MFCSSAPASPTHGMLMPPPGGRNEETSQPPPQQQRPQPDITTDAQPTRVLSPKQRYVRAYCEYVSFE